MMNGQAHGTMMNGYGQGRGMMSGYGPGGAGGSGASSGRYGPGMMGGYGCPSVQPPAPAQPKAKPGQ
jgi:hypothetical protein